MYCFLYEGIVDGNKASEAEISPMAQTAGVMCLYHLNATKPSLIYFMTINKAVFHKPVVLG